MKRFIYATLVGLGLFLGAAGVASAVSTFSVQQGGTGVGGASGFTTTGVLGASGINNLFTSATTTASCAGTASCSTFTVIGASPITITGSGLTTAITDIGAGGATTTGPKVTLATTTSTTNGITSALTITVSGSQINFQPSQSGVRSVAGGGTGAGTLTGCLTGNGTGAITGSGTCNTSAASVTSVGLSDSNSTLTIGSTPVTTSGTITATLNLAHSNTWSVLQTFSAASTTNITASQSLNVPSSSSQTPTSAGQTALDTTDNQLKIGDGSATAVFSSIGGFAVPYGATTTWTGSTSAQYIGNAPFGMTIKSVTCHTDAGTVNVQLQYSATLLPMLKASSTDGVQPIASNNTPAKGDLMQITYGTPATAPTFAVCTFSFTVTGS